MTLPLSDTQDMQQKQFAARNVGETVAQHKSMFFRMQAADESVIDYGTAVEGGLLVIRRGKDLDALRVDYQSMIEEGRRPQVRRPNYAIHRYSEGTLARVPVETPEDCRARLSQGPLPAFCLLRGALKNTSTISGLYCWNHGEIVRVHTMLVEAILENHFAESFV